MRKQIFVIACHLSLLIPASSIAQQNGLFSIQDGVGAGFSPTIIQVDDNRILLSGYSAFGYDSSYVKLVWLDNNFNILNHKEYRLTMPLNFVFHTVKHPTGFLIGTLESSSFGSPMSIIRTDTAGNVLRHDFAYDNPDWQEKIIQLVANNDGSFTGYSSKSNLVEEMYRIDGNIGDTVLHTKRIAPAVAINYFRPLSVADIDGAGLHMLAGSTYDADGSFHSSGLLMKLDTQQVFWGKQYDFGHTLMESSYGIIKLSDGNFAFVSQGVSATGTYFDGFITVASNDGDNIWTKKFTIAGGGVYPSVVVETENHDFLVFGNTHAYQGFCLKFNSTGNLISKKIMTGLGNTFFGNAIKKTNGEILAAGSSGGFFILQLDAEGNNCAFVDDTLISVEDYTPVIADLSFSMSQVSVPFFHSPVSSRNLATTSSELCISNSVDIVDVSVDMIIAFPVPAEDFCYLKSNSHQPVQYSLTDLSGRILTTGKFTNEATLAFSDFHQGVYLLRYKSGNNQGVIKLIH